MFWVLRKDEPLYDLVSFSYSTYLHDGFSKICSNPNLYDINDLFMSYFRFPHISVSKFLLGILLSIDIELKSILQNDWFFSLSSVLES